MSSVAKALPPDDPHYVQQLEATLCLVFVGAAMVDIVGPSAIPLMAQGLEGASDVVLSIMDRIGHEAGVPPMDPRVRRYYQQRANAGGN